MEIGAEIESTLSARFTTAVHSIFILAGHILFFMQA